MPKVVFLLMSSAMVGAALTYLAVGRRTVGGLPGSGSSVGDRARSIGDRIKATYRTATGADRGTAGPVNSAFEQHRAETIARLEDEQQQFKDFVKKLRHAKDQAEFDAFVAQRQTSSDVPKAAPTPGASDKPAV